MIKTILFSNVFIFSIVFISLSPSYLAQDNGYSTQKEVINSQLIPSEKNHNIQRRMVNGIMNPIIAKHNYENKSDTHEYYNSTIISSDIANKYFVDLDNEKTITNNLLSSSYIRATVVQLSFDFPFYGHMIRYVTITTGGFIYTGDYAHSWLTATQYIAPLMANFDTSLSNDSYIKYLDNGTSFTVQWENVHLQDNSNGETYTFQATLYKNGDIVFGYLNIPESIKSILDTHHPVKIGLSDGYLLGRKIGNDTRKTIFTYHTISFEKDDIKNWTVIYLTALPTCLQKRDCYSCLQDEDTGFKCTWCPETLRCSNVGGGDRFFQEWLQYECDRKQISSAADCKSVKTTKQDDDSDHVNEN